MPSSKANGTATRAVTPARISELRSRGADQGRDRQAIDQRAAGIARHEIAKPGEIALHGRQIEPERFSQARHRFRRRALSKQGLRDVARQQAGDREQPSPRTTRSAADDEARDGRDRSVHLIGLTSMLQDAAAFAPATLRSRARHAPRKRSPSSHPFRIGLRPLSFAVWASRRLMKTGMPMPEPSWIITCMSVYICLRLASSVSARAATRSLVELLVLPGGLVPGGTGLEEQAEEDVGRRARVDIAEADRDLHPVIRPVAIRRYLLELDLQAGRLGRLLQHQPHLDRAVAAGEHDDRERRAQHAGLVEVELRLLRVVLPLRNIRGKK